MNKKDGLRERKEELEVGTIQKGIDLPNEKQPKIPKLYDHKRLEGRSITIFHEHFPDLD